MSTHHTSRSRDENVPPQCQEDTARPLRPLQFRTHFNRSELRRLASFIGRHRDNYRVLGQDGDNLGVNESSPAGILFALFRGLDERGFVTVEADIDPAKPHREDLKLLSEDFAEFQDLLRLEGAPSEFASREVEEPEEYVFPDAVYYGSSRYVRKTENLGMVGESGVLESEAQKADKASPLPTRLYRYEVRDVTGALVGLYRYRVDADRDVRRLVARGEVGAVYVVNWERC